jgi:two-component system OmpR family sensor kinase
MRTRKGTSLNVRTRIGLTIAATTAAALAVSGMVAAAIVQDQVRDATEKNLNADLDEFDRLVQEGVDPDTGKSFGSPEAAVRTSMERLVPTPGEGALGYVDGKLRLTTRNASPDLTLDTELTDLIAPATTAEGVTYMTVATDVSTYRIAVVPVWEAANGTQVVGARPPERGDDPVAAKVFVNDEVVAISQFQQAVVIYAIVASLALVGASLIAWFVAGRLLRPVRVLASTASQIGRDDLTERIPVRGRDDLAEMTVAVNDMLDRLEAVVRSQTHLLNDVSHELRTPITIIRGHLELMNADDPADARAVRALGIDEVDRMSRIVEDLMTLAKADRPDFVQLASVAAADLTTSVVDKARALGDREWSCEEIATVTVHADAQRVTQAWLQLAANAVKFSEPGSAITLGSSASGRELELWVTDHGTGIATQDLESVFERFSQVSPASEGAGLGLPIVAAIARAHGGCVRVVSTPGAGSTFTIVLPLGPAGATSEGEHT